MVSSDSLSAQLLQQVFTAADARGLDQAQLATKAGLKPEMLSRAKTRADMELSTIERLAAAVGLQVVLWPLEEHASSLVQPTLTRSPAPLSARRFGLAASNPNAREDVLLRNALLQGRFHAILEAAAQDGVPFVRQQLTQLREQGELDETESANLERMVKSIERGFAEEGVNSAQSPTPRT